MTQQHHDDLNDRLQQVGLYNEHNLAANRIGNLSKSQHIRLEERQESITCMLWVCIFFCVILVFALIIGANYPPKMIPPGLLPAISCSTLLILGGLLIQKLEVRPVVGIDSVTGVQGVIKKRSVRVRNRQHDITSYYIEVNQISFTISQEIFDAFVEGQPYILYYVHTSMTLVAAEYILSS